MLRKTKNLCGHFPLTNLLPSDRGLCLDSHYYYYNIKTNGKCLPQYLAQSKGVDGVCAPLWAPKGRSLFSPTLYHFSNITAVIFLYCTSPPRLCPGPRFLGAMNPGCPSAHWYLLLNTNSTISPFYPTNNTMLLASH